MRRHCQQENFRIAIMKPLFEAGQLTLPGKPNRRNQKYVGHEQTSLGENT
jgi:hypothetical protein